MRLLTATSASPPVALGQLVDQLGGVEVFVPETMEYQDSSSGSVDEFS